MQAQGAESRGRFAMRGHSSFGGGTLARRGKVASGNAGPGVWTF